jgi:ATP-dependent exoDNAse (exonuclease V) beta subunit
MAWRALEPFLGKARELPIPAAVSAAAAPVQDSSATAQNDAIAACIASHDRVKHPSWSITSATADARHVVKVSRATDVAADDPTSVLTTDTPTHRADAGMAWGTLIHGLLEHAMRHPQFTAADLRRLAMWLTVEEPPLRAVIDEAILTVQSVVRAEFWSEAQRGEHHEETPFSFAAGRALTTGVIDLMHVSRNGWQVTDYKTDADGGVAMAAAYERQLATYRKALEACGEAVDGLTVQSVRGPAQS